MVNRETLWGLLGIVAMGSYYYREVVESGLPNQRFLTMPTSDSAKSIAEDIARGKERIGALRVEIDGLKREQVQIMATAKQLRGGSISPVASYIGPRMLSLTNLVTGATLALENGVLALDHAASSPMALRTFELVELGNNWHGLKSIATGHYLEMVPKKQGLAWVVRATPRPGPSSEGGLPSLRQQWRLGEIDGKLQLLNRECEAFLNVIVDGSKRGVAVRGHGNSPNNGAAALPSEETTFFSAATGGSGALAG
jgi:hypothetical protein